MPLFSSLLKSPTDSSPPRTVPNGGLGGFVAFNGEGMKKDGDAARDGEDGEELGQKNPSPPMLLTKKNGSGRKKPPPVQLNSTEISASARTAPMARTEPDFLRSPLMPMTPQPGANPRSAVVTDEGQSGAPETSSRSLWPRNKKAKLGRQGSGSLDTSTIPEEDSRSHVIELPGSLLLPDQGYVAPDRSQQQQTGRARAYSERSQFISTGSPSKLSGNSPNNAESRRTTFHIHQQRSPNSAYSGGTSKSSTMTTPTMIASPSIHTLITKNINTLSADELLKILPKLKSKAVTQEWIPAMEKEFAKIKALVHQYMSDKQEHKIIKIFGEDLKHLLDEARKIAERYDKEIAEAQAAIDINKQTDLEKIKAVQSQLQGALQAYVAETDASTTKEEEYFRLKSSLNHVLVILGGFIRNKLAHIMHQTDEGLTKEVTKLISAFDREQVETHKVARIESTSAQTYDETHKALVEVREKYNSAQELVREQQQVGSNTSAQLDKLLNQLEHRANEQKELDIKYKQVQAQLEAEQTQNTVYCKKIAGYEQERMRTEGNKVKSGEKQQEVPQDDSELQKEIQFMVKNHAQEKEYFEECLRQQNLKIEILVKRNAALRTQRTKSLHSVRTGPGFGAHVEVGIKPKKKQRPPSILLPGWSKPHQEQERSEEQQEQLPTTQFSPSYPSSPRLPSTPGARSVPRITIRSPTVRVSEKDEQSMRAQFSPYRRPQYHESKSDDQVARSHTPSRSNFPHDGEKTRRASVATGDRRPLSDITGGSRDAN